MLSRSPLRRMSQRRRAELLATGRSVLSTLTGGTPPARGAGLGRSRSKAAPHTYTGPTDQVRALVAARSGGRCEFPGCRKPAVDVHHRYERGPGGTGAKSPAAGWINQAGNLMDACRGHNDWCSNGSPAGAKQLGWLIKSPALPAAMVPVRTNHHPGGWVLLGDDGSWHVVHPLGEVA